MQYHNNYLIHHGVPGMKWGVRRFQDESGGITPRGRKYANKVEKSRILSKVHERRYKTILGRNYHDSAKAAASYQKAANNTRINAEKRAQYMKMAQQHTQRSKMLAQTFKDVDSGKLKAGRDYIV